MPARFLDQLTPKLGGSAAPVVLLKGARQLPQDKRQVLACGATVPGAKLELILPTRGMGRSRRPACATHHALDDLPLEERHHLGRESFAASPENHRLFELYLRGQSGNPAYAEAQYLVRDALKVSGIPSLPLAPATVALFDINNLEPTSGGTAHTIRLCEHLEVPLFTQCDWLA